MDRDFERLLRQGDRQRPRPARRPRRAKGGRGFAVSLVALPAAAFAAVFAWGGPPPALGLALLGPSPTARDPEAARFGECVGPVRRTCVVDGDTIWYHGEKIRIADINAPEVSEPHCTHEAELGDRATDRLRALLNAGPFTLEPIDRRYDKYGRSLYVITRQGTSLGAQLVREGLAETWKGYRRDWCAGG